MSLTGYIAKDGNDLSFIFQNGNSGQISEYKLANGQDIGTIFAAYTSYLAQPTGLISKNGSDINTLFNGRSYIPLSITGCSLWLDAADITTITKDASNRIEAWKDKSTNAFSFTQSTSGNKPTYTTNSQNGNATVSFASSDLQYLSSQSPLAIGTSSFALFVVGRYSDANSTMTMFAKSRYNAQDGRIFINRDVTPEYTSPSLYFVYTHPNNTSLTPTTENYSIGGYRLFELIVNRTQGIDYSFQNGIQLQTYSVTDTTNYLDNGNYMLVGAYNNSTGTTPPQSGYYLNGNISEIIAYRNSSDMTVNTRQRIEGYLAWKWGIQQMLPVAHPFISMPPT